MSDDCPNCGRPAIGSQIVELPHPHTDTATFGVVCAGCKMVYGSSEARRQVTGE